MSLEEVAKRCGVSPATVSRVLNGVPVVRSSTRARVMKAVAELKYRPNLHARSLAGGNSRTIGVIVSNLDNPFFVDIYRAVEIDCRVHKYEVLIADTGYRSERLMDAVRLMMGRRVAGLAVIASETDDAVLQELRDLSLPIVFYNAGTAGGNITKIRVDYRKGEKRIMEYLAALGHLHLGFIGHHADGGAFPGVCQEVHRGATIRIATDSDSPEGGGQAVREMLSGGAAPTAIICANDLMAVGALKELRERGVRVPQDISVTGFDNIMLSEFCYPALTTAHIPRDRIGHILFNSLAPGRSGPNSVGKEFVIEPELVLRDSTGPARR